MKKILIIIVLLAIPVVGFLYVVRYVKNKASEKFELIDETLIQAGEEPVIFYSGKIPVSDTLLKVPDDFVSLELLLNQDQHFIIQKRFEELALQTDTLDLTFESGTSIMAAGQWQSEDDKILLTFELETTDFLAGDFNSGKIEILGIQKALLDTSARQIEVWGHRLEKAQ